MYLAVDTGGTKVLMAAFSDDGKLMKRIKFPTPASYQDYLSQLEQNLTKLGDHDYQRAGVAIPAVIDRSKGLGVSFGNLSWKNVPVKKDLEKILNCPVILENDGKAGALYEAKYVNKDFKKVLYVAIGTGIGLAYVANGVLDKTISDLGGLSIFVERNGKTVTWESFSSGHAIVERFGKKASEITDPKVWKVIAHDIATGLLHLIALYPTEVVVFGGGVGAHFDRFKEFLEVELSSYETPVLSMPKLLMAANPEEAVIYGCYELARSDYAKLTR